MKSWICAALMLLLVTAGCQPKENKQLSVLRINIKDEPQALDPRKTRALTASSIMYMLFEGLVRKDKEGNAELALADSVQISADLRVYTFHLKRSEWSNGDPVTAHDFVYSWRKVLMPDFPSDVASALYVISHAQGIKEGKVDPSKLGVTALDPLTLQVELSEPTPYFLELLSQAVFLPVNQRIDEHSPQWMQQASTYVSNGPFSLTQWKHHQEMILQKNPHYWDAASVKLDQVNLEMLAEETEFHLFEKGELDWAGSPLSELPIEALSALKKQGLLHTQPALATAFLRTNTQVLPLSEVKIRQALALAIHRQELVDHVLRGEQKIATGLVPELFHLNASSYFKDGSTEQAKALWKEGLAALKISEEDVPEMTYLYRASDRNHLLAQAIQQQWFETFGIRVRLEAVEGKVFFSRVSRQDYQIAYGSWLGDFSDPINFLEVFKYSNTGTNNTFWENKRYIELLEKSAHLPSGPERQHLFAEAEKILIAEMPIIPLYYINLLYVNNPSVKDVVVSPGGVVDFKWASVEDIR